MNSVVAVLVHAAELQHDERRAEVSHPDLAEKGGTRTREPDGDGDGHHHWRQQDEQEGGQDEVNGPLGGLVEPLSQPDPIGEPDLEVSRHREPPHAVVDAAVRGSPDRRQFRLAPVGLRDLIEFHRPARLEGELGALEDPGDGQPVVSVRLWLPARQHAGDEFAVLHVQRLVECHIRRPDLAVPIGHRIVLQVGTVLGRDHSFVEDPDTLVRGKVRRTTAIFTLPTTVVRRTLQGSNQLTWILAVTSGFTYSNRRYATSSRCW